MTTIRSAASPAMLAPLSACGSGERSAEQGPPAKQTEAPAAQQTYSGAGTITAISGSRVTIAHGPIEGLGWPAMTMTFGSPSPGMLRGLSAGEEVDFSFSAGAGAYTLTSIRKSG